MTRRPAGKRRGVALPMALVTTVVLESLMLVALRAAMTQARLAADERGRIEGQLVVATALATARLAHRADLDTLGDGGVVRWPATRRPDGWSWRASAARAGALILMDAEAERRSADGNVYASHHASLLLVRDTADTVRVLGRRSRF